MCYSVLYLFWFTEPYRLDMPGSLGYADVGRYAEQLPDYTQHVLLNWYTSHMRYTPQYKSDYIQGVSV